MPTAVFPNTVGTGLNAPAAVAVDAAGNVYVSDIGANSIVEIPGGTGVGTAPFNLNFPSISTPGGVALDANGNLYVADSGGKQVLFDNRQHPTIRFGNVPENQLPAQPLCANSTVVDGSNVVQTTPASCPLTVSNIGNAGVTLTSPLTTISGAANPAFAVSNNCATIATSGPLPPGVTCQITATFLPTALGNAAETINVNGGAQSVALLAGTGVPPLAKVVLSAACSPGTTPSNGGTATITATVTQPFVPGVIPTGTVKFTYAIDVENKNANNCGTPGTQTVTLSPTGTASFVLPTLAQGVTYTVNADYSGDSQNSANIATPFEVVVPGIPVTSTVTSTQAQLTFTYGGTPPVIAGTVTPAPPAGITVKFGSAATSTSDITSPTNGYPVIVSFSGAGSCAYGFPSSTFANGSPAVVIENPALLTYALPAFTTQYGAPNITYGAKQIITGAVNGDGFGGTFVPSQSSILNANVSFTATETAGSPVLTNVAPANPTFQLSNLLGPQPGVPGQPGMILTGTGIPAGNPPTTSYTTITAIGANTVTMSANATASGNVTVNTAYEVVPTVIGKKIGDYTVNVIPGTLSVAQAPTGVSVTAANSSVLNTPAGISSATFQIAVSSAVPAGKGIPTGTVAVIDNYTPISSTVSPTPATATTCFTAQNTVAGSTVCAPVFTGSFLPGQPVTITDVSAGASIYYTLDGSLPTTTSPAYTAPITLALGQTLTAYAVVAGHADSAASSVILVALTAGVANYNPPTRPSFRSGSTNTASSIAETAISSLPVWLLLPLRRRASRPRLSPTA